jgi:hypothetical protein
VNLKFSINAPSVSLEMRGIQRHSHQQPRYQTGTWQSDNPGREDECNLLPVDSAEVEVAECDANGCAGKTLGRADRKAETTSKQDCDSGSELHGKTTCRRNLSNLIAERAHDVVAVN